MLVKEVMSREVTTVNRASTLRQLLQKFSHFHVFPLVAVVDQEHRLVGVVSFRKLLNVFQPHQPELIKWVPFLDEHEEDIFGADFTEEIGDLVIAEDIMEHKFVALPQDSSLEQAYRVMKLHLKEDLPVVDSSGTLVGRIGIFDIIKAVFHQKGVI